MGKIIIQFDIKNMSAVQYDQVTSDLDTAGLGAIPERLYHVSAPFDGGWHVTDVWESEEAFTKFAETMVPTLMKHGVEPAEPKIMPVHSIIVP